MISCFYLCIKRGGDLRITVPFDRRGQKLTYKSVSNHPALSVNLFGWGSSEFDFWVYSHVKASQIPNGVHPYQPTPDFAFFIL